MTEEHLRPTLKLIRDPNKSPYDLTSSGQEIGEIANILAFNRYQQKNMLKRMRARQSRQRKKKIRIQEKSEKKKSEKKHGGLPPNHEGAYNKSSGRCRTHHHENSESNSTAT